MKTNDFHFELPDRLIAQFPPEQRGHSRLMALDRETGERTHSVCAKLPQLLCKDKFLSPAKEKPLLVFNDTKVRKARLAGKNKKTGAQVEFLLLENAADAPGKIWKVMAQRSKRQKPGNSYAFFDNSGSEIAAARITDSKDEFRILEFDQPIDDKWLEKYGHIPLPPYIKRKDNSNDASRYQTVYAKQTGSAAAPTAGLHFTNELLNELSILGIESVFITLHAGLGTFLPVRSENIEDHIMHRETFFINDKSASKIEEAKAAGRKIIAVGTTSVRTMESAWVNGKITRGEQNTSMFIYPGYNFNVIDALFTNFHTPESTLLMLVSAFAGRDLILESYAEAVKESYRFFSYGDAMLIY
jgi:S-adenosylmethionine:tRNA ribosyltransferase-isomerase